MQGVDSQLSMFVGKYFGVERWRRLGSNAGDVDPGELKEQQGTS